MKNPVLKLSPELRGCSMDKCIRPWEGRTFCRLHLSRYYEFGDPAYIRGTYCTKDGCIKTGLRHGYCKEHYNELDPTVTVCIAEDCEPQWYRDRYCQRHIQQVEIHGKVLVQTVYDDRPAIIEGDIAKIPLGVGAKDGYTIVDVEDAWVARWKWHLDSSTGYVKSVLVENGKRQNVYLHRLIMGASAPELVDHQDGDRKDNRRGMLRPASTALNNANMMLPARNTSGYKGVSWLKANKKWEAYIGFKGKKIGLGYFEDVILAARAYDAKAIELFGEFARTNFGDSRCA